MPIQSENDTNKRKCKEVKIPFFFGSFIPINMADWLLIIIDGEETEKKKMYQTIKAIIFYFHAGPKVQLDM